MLAQSGHPLFDGLADALEGAPEVAVRLNSRKLPAGLTTGGMEPVEWCAGGVRLHERPAFTFDPLLHQGAYYVQDPSSMIIRSIVAGIAADLGDRPLTLLDACAAPGGKTTAAIDAMPDGSVVVANEFVPQRAAVLRENLAKWGYPLVKVTQGDTVRFSSVGEVFDIVLADVPCSGEGMMRKDDDARRQWTPALVDSCAALQREIVANIWPSLRPGGYLIYSTCTFNTAENEDNVRWICDTLGAETVQIFQPDPAWGIAPAVDPEVMAMRFLPGRIRGEGLFAAVLRKPDGEGASRPSPRKLTTVKAPREAEAALGWIDSTLSPRLDVDAKGVVTATFPVPQLPPALQPSLTIARIKGRDLIPTPQLALSGALRRGAFPEAEVDRRTALLFLRHESVTLPDSTPKGITLLTHRGLPLGFVKNLGNRANNLYQPEWRILSPLPSQLPPTPFQSIIPTL